MKKSLFVLTFICFLFASCKKENDGTDVKEDLSYLYITYSADNTIDYRVRTTYNGHKETSKKYYKDGQLFGEQKNYSYHGLNASWDYYTFQNGDVNDLLYQGHVECEYLDNTFQRKTYQKDELDFYHKGSQEPSIWVEYWEYDGKRIVGYKQYRNGILARKNHDYKYDGLHCTYKVTEYSFLNVASSESSYDVKYLDDTYLRTTESSYTTVYSDGRPPYTSYSIVDFDGKKRIGSYVYENGKLSSVSRDYQYDGLSCHYYHDSYRNGEVYSTSSNEVEYLE